MENVRKRKKEPEKVKPGQFLSRLRLAALFTVLAGSDRLVSEISSNKNKEEEMQKPQKPRELCATLRRTDGTKGGRT